MVLSTWFDYLKLFMKMLIILLILICYRAQDSSFLLLSQIKFYLNFGLIFGLFGLQQSISRQGTNVINCLNRWNAIVDYNLWNLIWQHCMLKGEYTVNQNRVWVDHDCFKVTYWNRLTPLVRGSALPVCFWLQGCWWHIICFYHCNGRQQMISNLSFKVLPCNRLSDVSCFQSETSCVCWDGL